MTNNQVEVRLSEDIGRAISYNYTLEIAERLEQYLILQKPYESQTD